LLVNGTIGDVDVLEMGRLGGTGKVENADIRGTLAAGQSIGTLWVDGNLTMRAGSVLEVEVDADGNADRIDVTGVARLEGGRVVTLASGGDYADQTTYTILSAEGGVEGEFEGIEANLAFLTASLAYNAKDVQLSLSRNSTTFSNVGETRNQIAAAGAVEPLGVGNAIYDRVLTLSAEDARLAFDQVSGEVHATAKGVFAKTSDQVRLSVDERVNASFARLGEAGDEQGVGANVWTSGNAAYGTLKGDGNAAPATFGAGNLFVGADAVFNDSWMLGVMGGIGRTSVRVGDRNSELSSSDYHVGVYGAGEVADFTFKLGGSYSHHEVSSTRTPTFPGFSETITADYSAGTSQVFGEIGHKFRFDSGIVIEPFANLALVNVYSGGYEEKGGVAALSAGSSSYGAGIISLGVRGSQKFTLGDDIKAEIKGALGWTHVAAGTPEATHSLGGNAFTVAGAPIDSDALTIKGGIGLALSENASLDFGYSGQLGSQGQTHGVNGTLSVKF
jgi:outer membrane autotransporter protein